MCVCLCVCKIIPKAMERVIQKMSTFTQGTMILFIGDLDQGLDPGSCFFFKFIIALISHIGSIVPWGRFDFSEYVSRFQ